MGLNSMFPVRIAKDGGTSLVKPGRAYSFLSELEPSPPFSKGTLAGIWLAPIIRSIFPVLTGNARKGF